MRFLFFALLALILAAQPVFAFNLFKKKGDPVRIARSFPDGGKYKLAGSGSPEAIIFHGETILPAGKDGTYCSGFTFAVVMRSATERGLLKNKSPEQIRQFQKEWYGATPESAEVQAGFAMKNLGIGKNIDWEDARPGDFIQFWRTKKTGHSAVFLEWIVENEKTIGFRYRSSQPSTDGISDKVEYFADPSSRNGSVVRSRTYIARLNSR